VRRLGANETVPVDVRIIAATNQDLKRRVEEGRFREDLYYRLNAVALRVPALRERRDDIPILATHFLTRYAAQAGKSLAGFAPETLAHLLTYAWPGNVRELEHVVERAVAVSLSAVVAPEDLPPEIRGEPVRLPTVSAPRMTLEELKRWYVTTVLEETGGNKVRAAEILGIDRRTLYRILERDIASDED
jgi:DNA-binding NtrC family response regulator